MNIILGIKLGRRMIATAALGDEEFTFGDQRFVTSRPKSFETAMGRYFDTVLDQIKPAQVFYYQPAGVETTASRLVTLLEASAARRQVTVRSVSKSDVFDHFGVMPIRTRRELIDVLQPFWSRLTEGRPEHRAVLAEAASVAMNGEVLGALENP